MKGKYWPKMSNIAAGGYVSDANNLIKFLHGVRKLKVLDEVTTNQMLDVQLGWYKCNGKYGGYYHHNGKLITRKPNKDRTQDPENQCLSAGIVRFPGGWDCILLINSGIDRAWIDPIPIMVAAFEG